MTILEFKQRLNTHQTHMEDLVLLGADGLDELNDKIEKSIEQLSGGSKRLNLTTKIDGAPAVICFSHIDGYPDNSICLKSFVSSANNCLSSIEDIYNKYGDRPEMAEKLVYSLELAKCIPAGEAWQGDCLFTQETLMKEEINGEEFLVFQPNKIVYAFSESNDTYEQIANADFGICFHTIYKKIGDSFSQSFNVDVTRLNDVPPNIYVMSPAISVSSNNYDISLMTSKYQELLRLESKLLSTADYEDLINNQIFMQYWNTFENASLSDKKATTFDVNTFYNDLKEYIRNKRTHEYEKKLASLKTDASKDKATNAYNADIAELEDILAYNAQVLADLVKCLNCAAEIKMLMWNGFKQTKFDYNTFYKSRTRGFIPADMEGIAMSDQDGNIVKVVDRSTFSNANRDPDIMSGFEH